MLAFIKMKFAIGWEDAVVNSTDYKFQNWFQYQLLQKLDLYKSFSDF